MDKIYRRETQLGGIPKKKKNEKNRKRNVIMNFRVSPAEKEAIEARIAMTGLSKSDFFIDPHCRPHPRIRPGRRALFGIFVRLAADVRLCG